MMTNVLQVPHRENLNTSTLTVSLPDSNRTLTRSPVHQNGSRPEGVDSDLTEARPPLTLSNQHSPRSSINNNYCVRCVAGNLANVYVTYKGTCTINCVVGNDNYASVSGRRRIDTVRILTVNSCLLLDLVERC